MRRLVTLALFAVAVLASVPAFAHEGHEHGPGAVVVVEVEGPLDQRVLDFVAGEVEAPDGQVVVLRIDSPGVASGDVGPVFDAIKAAPAPVVAWVGPQGAVAHGGVAQLLDAVDYAGAAPGVHIGYTLPTVSAETSGPEFMTSASLAALAASRVEIEATGVPPEFIDLVTPSIGQFIAALDGLEIDGVVLETADQTTLVDGSVVTVPSVDVRFVKPGLFTRFLRLSIRPEATFFFLVAGLTLAAFEFYAAGVGVTAAVAALSLFLSGYGLAVLPVRWWAVAASLVGLFLYTWDFQRNRPAPQRYWPADSA
jgi:membrane-bound serine protease (ClpP class)